MRGDIVSYFFPGKKVAKQKIVFDNRANFDYNTICAIMREVYE